MNLDRGRQYRPNAVRSRFSPTDRPSSVNKMFIIWPNKKSKGQKNNKHLMTGPEGNS